ncbi:MAG: protein kinase [Candidatus Margulisbacteria bacterium]|nr:protein kinase [Candidatus Margulisiibacteriota bacterium]
MKIINRNTAHPVLGLKRLVNYDFDQEKLIAATEFSEIYRQRARCGMSVAVKIGSTIIAKTVGKGYFIEREAVILNQLDHPNIIRSLCRGRYELKIDKFDCSFSFLALEYLKDFEDSLKFVERSNDRIAAALFIIEEAVRGLAYLHEQGLVHMDIKPSNILTNGRIAKLIDFALARPEGEELDIESKYRCIVGHQGYMSHSRFVDKKAPVKADDLFALGLTAAELCLPDFFRLRMRCYKDLAERHNEDEDHKRKIFQASMSVSYEEIRGSRLPESVKELIFRLIGESGRTQFASAQELLEFIRQVRASVI